MKNKKLIISILLLFILIHAKSLLAADTASSVTIDTYKVTITNFELSEDNGVNFINIFSGNKETDPAWVNSGLADVITQNITIPAGSYNYVRANNTVSGRVKFSAVINGTTYYSTEGGCLYPELPCEETDIWWYSTIFCEGSLSPAFDFLKDHENAIRINFYFSGESEGEPNVTLIADDLIDGHYFSWFLSTSFTLSATQEGPTSQTNTIISSTLKGRNR